MAKKIELSQNSICDILAVGFGVSKEDIKLSIFQFDTDGTPIAQLDNCIVTATINKKSKRAPTKKNK